MKIKRTIYRFLWNICKFIGLGYGGIFFAKEIKKMDEEFNRKVG